MTKPHMLVGVTESAGIVGCDRVTITRMAKDGRLPVAMRMPGESGALLFNREDVDSAAEQWAAKKASRSETAA